MNYTSKADAVLAVGGPGRLIGYGFTQDQAIQMAIATQLQRHNALLADLCRLIEDVASQVLETVRDQRTASANARPSQCEEPSGADAPRAAPERETES